MSRFVGFTSGAGGVGDGPCGVAMTRFAALWLVALALYLGAAEIICRNVSPVTLVVPAAMAQRSWLYQSSQRLGHNASAPGTKGPPQRKAAAPWPS
jgi:hypothetical protein